MCFRHRRHHHPKPPAPSPSPTPTPVPPMPPVTLTVAWSSSDASISAGELANYVAALNAQVTDITRLWPHVEECTHVVRVASGSDIPAELHPTIPEAPDALAYHYNDGKGGIGIRVGVQTCQRVGVSVSSAMSHEAAELTVDPSCGLTATAPNGDVWDLEVSDPVQASSYNVVVNGQSVEVSDFVGPDFFGMAVGPLDITGNVTRPFSIAAGGYAVVNGHQVLGRGARSWGDPADGPRSQRLAWQTFVPASST